MILVILNDIANDNTKQKPPESGFNTSYWSGPELTNPRMLNEGNDTVALSYKFELHKTRTNALALALEQ